MTSLQLHLPELNVTISLTEVFFEREGQLIEDSFKLKNIPGVIVQGRYDLVCPMKSAWDLSKKWPEAKLIVVDDAGHSAKEPGIQHHLLEACDKFKNI